MNTRSHLLTLGVGIVLLAGCRSLENLPQDVQSNPLPEPVVAERPTHLAMTLPRPRPPQAEALELGRALPEPGVPVPMENLSVTEVKPGPDVPDDLVEPEAVPPAAQLLQFPGRDLEFNLGHHSRHDKPIPLAFAPSSRALSGVEQPPTADPAEAAADTAVKTARAPAAPQARTAPESAVRAPQPAALRQPTEAREPDRELVARRGDPIAIDLEGNGWIYTGLRSGGVPVTGEDRGIEFLSTGSGPDRTSFNFRAVEYGDYELAFQYQDHQQALLRSQVIRLQVVPEQEFAAALQRQQPETALQGESTKVMFQAVPGPPIRSADALFDLGEYELALIEYMRNMRSGDPYLNDRLAQCYERTGEHLAAVKYYRENLGLEGEYGDLAALGLVRSSIATEDSPLLLEALPSLFSLESAQIGSELLEIARFQTEQRRFSVAIQALQQYVRRYPAGRELDEVYYRLAQIYEVDSPYRDLESARHYYGLLWDLFPESLYADPAAERLHYLDRHFFLVQ